MVGGGAAGLMAAGQAALNGAATLILEKMSSLGRKLGITARGRCNLTNIAPLREFIKHYGPNGRFLRPAFSEFFTSELISFLKSLGVQTVVEDDRRVFPRSGKAQDVVDALIGWVVRNGAKIQADNSVEKLLVEKGFIFGVKMSGGKIYKADAVIIATGGASYPATGSSGDGYRLAQTVGHNIVSVRPALVPIITAGDIARRIQGVSLRNVKVSLIIGGMKAGEITGEMLFTHFGLSGPIILTLSKQIVDALCAGKETIISIDLAPQLEEEELDKHLLYILNERGRQKTRSILKTLLPEKLIPVCAQLSGVDSNKLAHQVTVEERRRLRLWLKDFRISVIGYRPLKEAMVTAGGVDLDEVEQRTMQSRLVRGLYFAGEVLDIDGDTGGYNLQAAFSTGRLAGQSAAGK